MTVLGPSEARRCPAVVGCFAFLLVSIDLHEGRKKGDIVRIRGVFRERDRTENISLDIIENQLPVRPTMVVQSSPGKYHSIGALMIIGR